MARLEDLTPGATLRGILPAGNVSVVDVRWYGTNAIELTYKDGSGRPGNEILYRDAEARLEVITAGRPWSFDADGALLRLVSEAQRIRLAHLFDPYLAVHTSDLQPLPHQITAVYDTMLPRQPLRFLLADDPGAGKTIMAGLLIKELMMRGVLQRCLIVCPGNLAEQWQDELDQRFQLPFDILTNEGIETARSGNVFSERPLFIARLDKLARDESLHDRLAQVDWDLVVVDEAHKMSASFFSGEVKYTKRYRLGQKLAASCRHFLLMTATPHSGKEEDFQLFLALLDADRFEGRFRDGVHSVDASDLMRRMVKEQLLKFDGRPLFPERLAYAVPYRLSDLEASLYRAVTEYVRQEFNRADALADGGQRGTVGFALTTLQRRLASSPEAIYQSIKRRRERLEGRLREMELQARGLQIDLAPGVAPLLSEDELADLDDAPADEVEDIEEAISDQATAARTLAELRYEIETLARLEQQALAVRNSRMDRKWEELSRLLQDEDAMFDAEGRRRKLVIFTEHRDTLNYLLDRIRSLLGKAEAVVAIHGGIHRDERRRVQELFTQDKDVMVLAATDAAGEGINLQRAHLMINYDLPWNPNRLEQRFGRIHRIGQTEVCHLWNLMAQETREGDVYLTLLRKLERERQALGGAVFDVIGRAIDGAELRRLMIEAIRYGDQPEVRERLNRVVEGALDQQRLRELIEERALAHEIMDSTRVHVIRQVMERMEARRLQPHFIAGFFKAAFEHLGGALRERESGRYEIPHVPALIRQRRLLLGGRQPIVHRYDRICFEKELIHAPGKPEAAFVCPGHPLLDATLDLILERSRDLLRQGAILVDERDPGEDLRALVYLEHTIRDATTSADGHRQLVSQRLQFVEMPLADDEGVGAGRDAGPAPYLDYRPLRDDERDAVAPIVQRTLATQDIEDRALAYAIERIVPQHLQEVRSEREARIDKTLAAVKDRLTKEITYWDGRAEALRLQEAAGRVNARINSERARQRRDELEGRLQRRLEELQRARQLAAAPPAVIGGALIVPGGLLARLRGERQSEAALFARATKRVELAAMAAVMAAEQALGHEPRDVHTENRGFDIESHLPGPAYGSERLRFIEVKGRIRGAETVTISKNEILTAFNKPDDWVLALVEVPLEEEPPADVQAALLRDGFPVYEVAANCSLRYVRRPFQREPDFDAVSVNYSWAKLWSQGTLPEQRIQK